MAQAKFFALAGLHYEACSDGQNTLVERSIEVHLQRIKLFGGNMKLTMIAEVGCCD